MNDGAIYIVALQRGWVAVGRRTREGAEVRLSGAHWVRRWGTTSGLGQLATEGPLDGTRLDPAPLGIEYHYLAEVHRMPCDESKWGKLCK